MSRMTSRLKRMRNDNETPAPALPFKKRWSGLTELGIKKANSSIGYLMRAGVGVRITPPLGCGDQERMTQLVVEAICVSCGQG